MGENRKHAVALKEGGIQESDKEAHKNIALDCSVKRLEKRLQRRVI